MYIIINVKPSNKEFIFPLSLGRLVQPFCCSDFRPWFCPECNSVSYFARSFDLNMVIWCNSGMIIVCNVSKLAANSCTRCEPRENPCGQEINNFGLTSIPTG